MPEGTACEVDKDACCAGMACIEFTVYDWPRCRPRLPDGAACVADAQCQAGVCGANHLCGPAPICRALNDTCVVGEDVCCEGSCVEYTVYDWPRCRKP
jgi:hypothetical protein